MLMSSACAPDTQSDVIARKIVRESIAYTMQLREPNAADVPDEVEMLWGAVTMHQAQRVIRQCGA